MPPTSKMPRVYTEALLADFIPNSVLSLENITKSKEVWNDRTC